MGSKLKEVKPFFHGISPQHTLYVWEDLKIKKKKKKKKKKRFLFMLGEFKSDQLFFEKTKLANNL